MFFCDNFFLHKTGKGDKVNKKVRNNMETAADTQTVKRENRKPRRFSIGPKLSILIVIGILLSSFGVLAAVFIIYRHKANIDRLLHGRENKIKSAR